MGRRAEWEDATNVDISLKYPSFLLSKIDVNPEHLYYLKFQVEYGSKWITKVSEFK